VSLRRNQKANRKTLNDQKRGAPVGWRSATAEVFSFVTSALTTFRDSERYYESVVALKGFDGTPSMMSLRYTE